MRQSVVRCGEVIRTACGIGLSTCLDGHMPWHLLVRNVFEHIIVHLLRHVPVPDHITEHVARHVPKHVPAMHVLRHEP